MSDTIITFGNLGSPSGLAIQFNATQGYEMPPPGYPMPPVIVRPGPQTGLPTRNVLRLRADYFPAPVSDAYTREGDWANAYRVPAGTCITCSAEEAGCLYAVGAVE